MAAVPALTVDCPLCRAQLVVPVTAEINGRADDGTLQVDVLADKTEIKHHALVCAGTE